MGLIDRLVNLIAQIILRALKLLWDALIQLIEGELLELVELGLSFSASLIEINKVLPVVVILLFKVFAEVFKLFSISDQLPYSELPFLERIKLLLEVLRRLILVLLNLIIQGLLSSLNQKRIVGFKSSDLLGQDLSLSELLHPRLHSIQLSFDPVHSFLKLAFLGSH